MVWPSFAYAVGVAALIASSLAVGVSSPGPASATTNEAGPTTRIVGGIINVDQRIPTRFFALVQSNSNEICAGTVIGAHWIVTAAHCVDGRRNPTVAINPARFDPASFVPQGTVRIPWETFAVHPGFNRVTLVNDIALIKVKQKLTARTLPYAADPIAPTVNDPLQVFGFGLTSYNGRVSSYLREATINDLTGPSGSSCGAYGPGEFNSAGQICAGVSGGGVDACNGDSGGPLTNVAEPRKLLGIVSGGTGCAEASYPGVYTRVSAHAGWIQSVTGIAPDTPAQDTWGPAYLAAGKPCGGAPCTLRRGQSSTLRIVNYGGRSAKFRAIGSGFRYSARQGVIKPLESRLLRVSPKMGGGSKCVRGSIRDGRGKTLSSFNFGVGGTRC